MDGPLLREMLGAASRGLEGQAAAVNAINVFPVPDGDTGTNMSLTMRAAVEAATDDAGAGAVARAMARGALLGARGNSGVILSQILRGLGEGLAGRDEAGPGELAAALNEAADAAYAAVSEPVEGTILSVARAAANGAQEAASRAGTDLDTVLAAATEAAGEAVQRTPQQLAVLAEAGVVDAGGQGLFLLLEGALRCLRGESTDLAPARVGSRAIGAEIGHGGDSLFGYCTEFVVTEATVERAELRQRLASLGDSLLVVGEGDLLRVHIHTDDPGAALSLAAPLGRLARVKVDDMEAQHAAAFGAGRATTAEPMAVVAVSAGEGFSELFRSAGAAVIVPGGQSMNPSAEELLAGIREARAEDVILLPNNKNIVMAARQAAKLAEARVHMVPTTSMAGGVAALLAYNAEHGPGENALAMAAAAAGLRVAEVTRAVRDAMIGGVAVAAGQAIALVDGELRLSADNEEDAVLRALDLMVADASLVTLYAGGDVDDAAVERLAARIRAIRPGLEVEAVRGGQPAYSYLLSVE